MNHSQHDQDELVCELPFEPDNDLTPLFQVCEVELVYKSLTQESYFATRSQEAYELLKPYFKDHLQLQEQFVVMYLNSSHKVLGIYAHSKGGITGTVVDVRLIFCTALKLLATGIILAHSHPSGSLKQSKRDEMLTKQFQEATNFLDIKLLNHLIVTSNSYKSFVQEGLL